MNSAELARLARTVLQLRPAQIGQRVRLRAQRIALDWSLPLADRWLLSGADPAAGSGWPAGFTPLDARLRRDRQDGKALRTGEFRLLGVARAVAMPGPGGTPCWGNADWESADAPLLWRYHLYYWDWAWALLDEDAGRDARVVFAAIWRSWHAAVAPGRGAAWHPYPAALRAWSFCGLYRSLIQGGPVDELFRGELAAHAGFLSRNLETDVGGNHLIKNLKALAGLAVFFADDDALTRVLRRLRRQLTVQVLSDGGHYERAPAYHCQVLGDLIDIASLLRAAGQEVPAALPEAIMAMRRWLSAVLTPAGEVPLLNDGFPVSQDLVARLVLGSRPPAGPLCLLPETGLARATVGSWHVLADIGSPCPRELPAHAHADTLSCLVHVAGVPLLIDTGTSTYEVGAVRDRERSTGAHNTLEVDRRNSTEVWGAFRAGRRARVIGAAARVNASARLVTVEAAHDGYRGIHGQPRHHRRWVISEHELRVDDTVTGRGRHRIVLRWHLAPGTQPRLVPGGAIVTLESGRLAVTVTATHASESTLTSELAEVATGFASTVRAPVLTFAASLELPVRISTVWRRTEPRQEPT